jgi:hypothetical protein
MVEDVTGRVPEDHKIVALAPHELRLMRLVGELDYGRIEGAITRINVQAGLPVSAEVTRQVRLDGK